MKQTCLASLFVLVGSLVLLAGYGGSGCHPCEITVPHQKLSDLPYATVPNVDPGLVSLDLWRPDPLDASALAPVVIWVHGGGWRRGDKANGCCDKVNLFVGRGWIFASVNYRLSPDPPELGDPDRVRYPVHEQDVAAAVAWLYSNVADYGGDPSRMALLGHSAGAHLVAIVSTDASFLGAHGLGLEVIRCTGSLDTEGYDIPDTMADPTDEQSALYENAFGSEPAVWAQASPQTHVAAGRDIPPFLLVSRGSDDRRAQVAAFAESLIEAGVSATVIDAAGYSHAEVNQKIGDPKDHVMTPAVMSFLEACFSE